MALCKDDVQSDWKEIFELLLQLRRDEIAICPTSPLHREEGVRKRKMIPALKDVCQQLSDGIEFMANMDIQLAQIMEYALIWLNNLDKEVSLQPNIVLEKSDDSSWRISYKVNQVNRGVMQRGDKDYEEIYKRWESEDKSLDEYFVEEYEGFLGTVKSSLQRYRMVQIDLLPDTRNASDEDYTYFQWFDALKVLFARQGGNTPQLIHDFFTQSDLLSHIPCVRLESIFWASLAFGASNEVQRKKPPKKQYGDVSFISSYAPYCDCILVDKEWYDISCGDRVEKELAKWKCTEIFCETKLDSFKTYLQELSKSVSRV